MRKFSPPAMENLAGSIRYTLDFMEKNLSKEKSGLFGETAIQVLRDQYLLKKGAFLTGGIGQVFEDLNIAVTDRQKELLIGLEKSLRNEEDYGEFSDQLTGEDIRELLTVLQTALK